MHHPIRAVLFDLDNTLDEASYAVGGYFMVDGGQTAV